VDEVNSAPGWSPDGKQMAYQTTRRLPPPTVDSLVVADADGLHARARDAHAAEKLRTPVQRPSAGWPTRVDAGRTFHRRDRQRPRRRTPHTDAWTS
jgi:hypothetical protein